MVHTFYEGSGAGPSTENGGVSADEHKQHDWDHKMIGTSFKPLCNDKNALN